MNKNIVSPFILHPSSLYFAIISNRFNRTTRQSFVTQILLFVTCRLLEHERVTVLIRPHEVIGRRIAADVAVNA